MKYNIRDHFIFDEAFMKPLFPGLAVSLILILAAPIAAHSFMKDGCGSGECRECHTLTRDEAAAVLGQMVDKVLSVGEGPIKGLWVVDIEKGGQKVPIYLDYAKRYIVSGQVFEFASRRNLTGERYMTLNRPDVSRIPVDDAILVGSPTARRRVIVFTNPDCPHCARLHREILKVSAARPDVAFYMKIVAGPDPASREKARSLLCSRSVKDLEQAFEGKEIPPAPAVCSPDIVDRTTRLAESLNVRSTPMLLLPDGTMRPGFHDADTLLGLLAEPAAGASGPEKGAVR